MENWAKGQKNSGERKPSYLVNALHKLTKGRIDVVDSNFEQAIVKLGQSISLVQLAHNTVYKCQPLLARANLCARWVNMKRRYLILMKLNG